MTLAIKQTLACWEGTMQLGLCLMLLPIWEDPERGLPELRQRPHKKAYKCVCSHNLGKL